MLTFFADAVSQTDRNSEEDGNADGENAEVERQLTYDKGETEEETIKPIRDKGSWKWI